MQLSSTSIWHLRLMRMAKLAGTAVAMLGCAVLIGWAGEIEVLKRLKPGLVAMNPATALGFMLCGLALLLNSSRTQARWGLVFGSSATLIGVLRITEYAVPLGISFDGLLFKSSLNNDPTGIPNRMAPNTALLFMIAGLSLSTQNWASAQRWRVSELLALVSLLLSLMACVGYSYGVKPMYGVAAFIPMAVHTACGFLVLSVGILLARPAEGLTAILTSPHAGSQLAWRMLPGCVGIVLLLSWLRLRGQQLGLYETEFGVALMAVLSVALLTGLVWWNAAKMNASDLRRQSAELRLRLANENLEEKVRLRTTELSAANESLSAEVAERTRAQQELVVQAQELQRSNRELEQFAYVASHDLQEPLRMVGSYLQLLSRRYKGKLDADADEFIRFAVDGANRMKSLINDLLEFSRVDRRGRDPVHVNGSDILNETLRDLSAVIKQSGAKIESQALPQVIVDPTQLRQVFQNLIGNAIKFRTQSEPHIRVHATESPQEWTFEVADNGIGIEPQYATRVFELFQRLHNREEYPGNGLGLSICKKIIERHGGRIWVEPGVECGSIFRFTLPKSARKANAYKHAA